MAERRHAPDREPGRLARGLRGGLLDAGRAGEAGQLSEVDAVRAGREHEDRRAVRDKHQRLNDLPDGRADGSRGVFGGPGARGILDDVYRQLPRLARGAHALDRRTALACLGRAGHFCGAEKCFTYRITSHRWLGVREPSQGGIAEPAALNGGTLPPFVTRQK